MTNTNSVTGPLKKIVSMEKERDKHENKKKRGIKNGKGEKKRERVI